MILLRLPFSLQPAALVLASLCFFLASALAAETTTLKVTKDHVPLYSRQEEHSEIIIELKAGDQLTPLANSVGNQSWFLVQTKGSETGWVRREDVEGSERLEKLVREGDTASPYPVISSEGAKTTGASLGKETSVPIEMSGSVIIVPVEINRSVKTFMVMDTGATFTQVAAGLAKRLGLRLGMNVVSRLANGSVSKAPTSRLSSVRVGNAEVHDLVVTVQDFSPHPQIEGLLGLDFLRRFHTSIDAKNQRLVLTPR